MATPRRSRGATAATIESGRLDEAEVNPCDFVRDTIHEIRRVEKYRRYILIELDKKVSEYLAALLFVGSDAHRFECFVRLAVGVAGDVEPGVIALAGVPER